MLFETKRLIIREFKIEDVKKLSKILAKKDVMEYSINGVMSIEKTKEFIDWCLASHQKEGIAPWVLENKIDHEFIGFSGLSKEIINDCPQIHIGYRLAKKYWGKGLATEAVIGCTKYGFTHKNIESILAIVEPDHKNSIRVLNKSGFKLMNTTTFHKKLVNIYCINKKLEKNSS